MCVLNLLKTACISIATLYHPHYLQAGALVWERRAKEACDNAHDRLSYITLQRGVCMLPITGVVAHLGRDRGNISMVYGRWITLPACRATGKVTACRVSIITQSNCVTYPANVHQEVLKQLPHVVGRINLLHLHLCVHIAMVQEVDIGDLDLLECRETSSVDPNCELIIYSQN